MSDDLIERAQAGDDSAFQQLVQEYTPLVRRVVRTFLANPAVAEDIIQDTWLDVWRGLSRFDHTRPFRPWVLTIVANRCRMANRRRALATTPLDATAHDIAWTGEDGSEQMIRSETDVALTAALAALAPDLRQLIELRYFAKLEIADIAAVTDVPVGIVKSRIYRTLAALRTHLRELDSEVVEGDQRMGVGETAPPGATVYMTAGWVPWPDPDRWALNSSGIISTARETYILVVYTQNQPTDDWSTFDHVGSMVAQLLA